MIVEAAHSAVTDEDLERNQKAPEGLAPSQGNGSQTSIDYFCNEDGERFAGKHLLVDIRGGQKFDDIAHIEQTLKACIEAAGATLLHIHLHHFTPFGGVSGVAVLAESHISIHTWPEEQFAALDVFMCGNTQPEKAIDVLKEAFKPDDIAVQTIKRGRVHAED